MNGKQKASSKIKNKFLMEKYKNENLKLTGWARQQNADDRGKNSEREDQLKEIIQYEKQRKKRLKKKNEQSLRDL